MDFLRFYPIFPPVLMTFSVRGFTSVNAECYSALSKQGVSEQNSWSLQSNSLLVYTTETLSVWVALSTCRATWWLIFGFLSCIKRAQDWSVLPFCKAGIVRKSALQRPAFPPPLFGLFKARNGTLFIVRVKLAESSPWSNQPSDFQLLPIPAGLRPAFPSWCHIIESQDHRITGSWNRRITESQNHRGWGAQLGIL